MTTSNDVLLSLKTQKLSYFSHYVNDWVCQHDQHIDQQEDYIESHVYLHTKHAYGRIQYIYSTVAGDESQRIQIVFNEIHRLHFQQTADSRLIFLVYHAEYSEQCKSEEQ